MKVSSKIKKIFLTGGMIAGASISLFGCMFQPNLGYDNETYRANYYDYQDYGGIYDITGADYSTSGYSTSYNSFLYNSNHDISEAIIEDLFGYAVSRQNNNADRRLFTGLYERKSINMSNDEYESYVHWINGKKVYYAYSDLMNVEQVLKDTGAYYRQYVVTQKHNDLICPISQIPSKDLIKSILIRNSDNYLNTHMGYYRLSDEYYDYIASIFYDAIVDYHDILDNTTLEKIYCMAMDIKAVGINSNDLEVNDLKKAFYARVTDDDLVIIDTNLIQELKDNNGISRTICHEVMHLFQRMCNDEKKDDFVQIGSSQYIENYEEKNKINSLHWQWLYEASAEELSMANYGAKTPIVYKNMVGYLKTLDLITLIRPDYENYSIAISQMSNDPELIFKVLGAETEEEKIEIAQMLYSICVIQNEREDFCNAYSEKYSGDLDLNVVKFELKKSIGMTMTKYFYKNLSERVSNTDVSLQDVFYLINVFECCMNRHFGYDESDRIDYNVDFIDFYIEVQNQFFKVLANNSNNYTYDELITMFDDYAMVIKYDGKYSRNFDGQWLMTSEKDYIGDILTTNIQYFTFNIRNMVNIDFYKNASKK